MRNEPVCAVFVSAVSIIPANTGDLPPGNVTRPVAQVPASSMAPCACQAIVPKSSCWVRKNDTLVDGVARAATAETNITPTMPANARTRMAKLRRFECLPRFPIECPPRSDDAVAGAVARLPWSSTLGAPGSGTHLASPLLARGLTRQCVAGHDADCRDRLDLG